MLWITTCTPSFVLSKNGRLAPAACHRQTAYQPQLRIIDKQPLIINFVL
jgi:hypothetical protein